MAYEGDGTCGRAVRAGSELRARRLGDTMGPFYEVLIGLGRSAESRNEFRSCNRVFSGQRSRSDSGGATPMSQVHTQRESPLGGERGMVEGALIGFDWGRGFFEHRLAQHCLRSAPTASQHLTPPTHLRELSR